MELNMKTIKAVITVLISTLLIGCPGNEMGNEIDDDEDITGGPPPISTVIFIKFSQPEYKEYVLGIIEYSEYLGKEHVYVVTLGPNGSRPREGLAEVKKIPMKTVGAYIELPDNYLIIGPLLAESVIIGFEYDRAILNLKWEEWDGYKEYFSLDQILDRDNPLREIWSISAESLREFNGGVLEYTYWYPTSLYHNVSNTAEAYTEYTEIISRIIEQGKIEEYCKRKK